MEGWFSICIYVLQFKNSKLTSKIGISQSYFAFTFYNLQTKGCSPKVGNFEILIIVCIYICSFILQIESFSFAIYILIHFWAFWDVISKPFKDISVSIFTLTIWICIQNRPILESKSGSPFTSTISIFTQTAGPSNPFLSEYRRISAFVFTFWIYILNRMLQTSFLANLGGFQHLHLHIQSN